MALTARARQTLERATSLYQADVTGAHAYLANRGIDQATATKFRLGYVKTPITGHEQYTGRLAIPYITPSGVVDIRFRCLADHNCKDHGHGKYMTQAGHRARLYYTPAIITAHDTIAICEGELDAIILNKLGIPAVGVAGAQAWQSDYYPRIFADFSTILIFGDGDEAGRAFARNIANDLPEATIINMPDDYDITDLYLDGGNDALLDRAGLNQTAEGEQ